MSVLLTCPNCHKKLKVGDNLLGRNVECPGCATAIPAKAPGRAAPKKAAPPPDDEGEAPRRPAKASRKDDDEDGRPAKKKEKKRKSSAGLVLAIGGAVVLLLLLGGGVLAYIHSKGAKSDTGAIADARSQMPANGPAGGPAAGPKEPVGEPLTGPRPATFPEGWKEYISNEAGFRVMLPGKPVAHTFDMPDGTQSTTVTLAMTKPGEVNRKVWDEYLINVRDYPYINRPALAEAHLKDAPKAAWVYLGGKETAPLNEKAGTFAGKPGRAWDMKDVNGGTWHFRLCLSGIREYMVGAGPETTIPAADADLFFSSFELLAK